MSVDGEDRVAIHSDGDIVAARQRGRALAREMGFSSTDQVLITTAISELARNILLYAEVGEIVLRRLNDSPRKGLLVVAQDRGPGIPNVEQAMQAGYSTSSSLGLGLPGVKRLMDEIAIDSKPGGGTIVTAKKWKS
ncbi:MAG TPA: anti-sigma regulatory factor [Candidatus Polarisedimenticolaceae bacterium]|nr:anti-sigma regulatory factor [Candidatus Polarisedimenticolaceae bacterium]